MMIEYRAKSREIIEKLVWNFEEFFSRFIYECVNLSKAVYTR